MSDWSKLPWYQRLPHLEREIAPLVWGVVAVRPDERPILAEIETALHLSVVNLIFESNQTENAGRDRMSTRRLIEENFPRIEHDPVALRQQLELRGAPTLPTQVELTRLFALYESRDVSVELVPPQIRYQGHSRDMMEVLGHTGALWQALGAAQTYALRRNMWVARERILPFLQGKGVDESLLAMLRTSRARALAEGLRQPARRPNLISVTGLRRLHRALARGLEAPDWGTRAGQYRNHGVFFGDPPVAGVSPENLPRAVQRFVRDANGWLYKLEGSFLRAARIAYEFVRIHPFPDFNGRISRLLAAMVLHADGLPLVVTTRADAKSKARYRQALQRADRGQGCEALASLLAQSALESLQGLDQNLRRAALPSLSELAARLPESVRGLRLGHPPPVVGDDR